jgi:hypothetical protein
MGMTPPSPPRSPLAPIRASLSGEKRTPSTDPRYPCPRQPIRGEAHQSTSTSGYLIPSGTPRGSYLHVVAQDGKCGCRTAQTTSSSFLADELPWRRRAGGATRHRGPVKSSNGVPTRRTGRKWRHSCKQCGGMGAERLKRGKGGGHGRVNRVHGIMHYGFLYIGCSFSLTCGVSGIHDGTTRLTGLPTPSRYVVGYTPRHPRRENSLLVPSS